MPKLAKISSSRVAIPTTLLMILAMIILPLPPLLLDAFFTFNIVLAITVLLVSTTTRKVLDFSVFPTLLLIATLLRLTLNVASTRVVLLEGHEGGDAAGQVIQAFGEVVIGGSYVVGIVVFTILMIINFVVITKGGERISEVSARFTLDALPGKQMAIDADLNAGLIDQAQAKERRESLAAESEFYGAMDGASKFVRGDAIAGLMILFINLIGGVLIGIFEHGLTAGDSFKTYALLTIGDGLVAQIPSLLLAVSSAIIVTRIDDGESENVAETVNKQILAQPSVLYMASAVMFIIGSVPNMPHLAFYTFAAIVGFVGWQQSKISLESKSETQLIDEETQPLRNSSETQLDWSIIPRVDPISLSLGFKLVSLATKSKNGSLLKSIRGTRKTLSEQIGFLLPEVIVRDNLKLKPAEYAIYIDGDEIERGEVVPERLMAVGMNNSNNDIDGVLGFDPAYRLPALWIDPKDKTKAINYGYQVIDIHDVIATHLNKVCAEHLDEIFNYDDVKAVNQRLAQEHPELLETLGSVVTPNLQMQVIRQLLADQVPVRNIRAIANSLIESGEKTKDPILLASNIRVALKRTIMNLISPQSKQVNVFTLGAELDAEIKAAVVTAQQQDTSTPLDGIALAPEILQKFQNKMPSVLQSMQTQGIAPVVLVAPTARPIISKLAKAFAKGLIVLSFNEIPNDYSINTLGSID